MAPTGALARRRIINVEVIAPGGRPDLVEHHPFQTTRSELKYLRQQLLCHLPRHLTPYSVAANETHLLSVEPSPCWTTSAT